MFEYGSVKLLLLAIVALVVVGPKEFPVLVRTMGKYIGMVRRQAAEFREQWDQAVRESEVASIKSQVDTIGHDLQSTLHDTEARINSQIHAAERGIDTETTHHPVASLPPAEPLSPAAQAAAAAARSGA